MNDSVIDKLKEMKTIACPDCGEVLDSTNQQILIDHIKNKHPDAYRRIQAQAFLDDVCKTGLLRRVPR